MPQAFARRRAQTRDAALSCTGMQVWLSLASDAGDTKPPPTPVQADAAERDRGRLQRGCICRRWLACNSAPMPSTAASVTASSMNASAAPKGQLFSPTNCW